jgi:hypothetical protein
MAVTLFVCIVTFPDGQEFVGVDECSAPIIEFGDDAAVRARQRAEATSLQRWRIVEFQKKDGA